MAKTTCALLISSCIVLLCLLHSNAEKTEVLMHFMAEKGHFNPNSELIKALYDTKKYHVTVAARVANVSSDIFPLLQKKFGQDVVCEHPPHSNQRSKAFDCPITVLTLDYTLDFAGLLEELSERGESPSIKHTPIVLELMNPTASVEALYDYYFSPDSTLPKPKVYIDELSIGLEPFALQIKKRIGKDVHVFYTFPTMSTMLPGRKMAPSYLHPILQQLIHMTSKQKVSTQTSNPLLMLVNKMIFHLLEQVGIFFMFVKNYLIPKLTSNRPELFTYVPTSGMISLGDVLLFSKEGVQEPPSIETPGNFHFLGSSLSSTPKSDSEEITSWLSEMEKQGRQVIFISMGSVFKMKEEQELAVSRALVDLLNKSNKYAVIWRVKGRAQRWKDMFDKEVPSQSEVRPFFLTSDYVPQPYIMNHPATSLFMTHCGFNGITEALFFGKKLIGLPFMYEQRYNCQHLEDIQVGKYITAFNGTKEAFHEAFVELLETRSEVYTANAKKMQGILQRQRGTAAFLELLEKRLSEEGKEFNDAWLLVSGQWLDTAASVVMLLGLVVSFKLSKRILKCCFCCMHKKPTKQKIQ